MGKLINKLANVGGLTMAVFVSSCLVLGIAYSQTGKSGGIGPINGGKTGGGGTPGGSNAQVQFNDSGSFGGNSGLTFNKATGNLAVGGTCPAGVTSSLCGTAFYLTGTGPGTVNFGPGTTPANLAGIYRLFVDSGNSNHLSIEDPSAFVTDLQSPPTSFTSITVGSGTPTTSANAIHWGTDTIANLYRSAAGTVTSDAAWFFQGNVEVLNSGGAFNARWFQMKSSSGSYTSYLQSQFDGEVDLLNSSGSPAFVTELGSQLKGTVAVASLPSCGSTTVLLRRSVNDAISSTPGTTAVGGGTFTIAVQCIFNSSGSVYSWIID